MRLKVLIVEDHDDTRRALREVAQEVGLEPITRTRLGSTSDVWQAADILIMDWHLPNGDPHKLLELWRGAKVGPVAVLYSEMNDQTQAQLLTHCQLWNVVPQPVDVEVLRSVFENLLRRYADNILGPQRMDELERRLRVQSWWITGIVVALALALLLAVLR